MKDPFAALQSAWAAGTYASCRSKPGTYIVYEANALRFDVRALDKLLDIPRKGLLANALRRAGHRNFVSGPLPGLRTLQLDHYASSEVWTSAVRWLRGMWHGTAASPGYLPANPATYCCISTIKCAA
jgi:hypothetical protein